MSVSRQALKLALTVGPDDGSFSVPPFVPKKRHYNSENKVLPSSAATTVMPKQPPATPVKPPHSCQVTLPVSSRTLPHPPGSTHHLHLCYACVSVSGKKSRSPQAYPVQMPKQGIGVPVNSFLFSSKCDHSGFNNVDPCAPQCDTGTTACTRRAI